jgi:hypothetical protein
VQVPLNFDNCVTTKSFFVTNFFHRACTQIVYRRQARRFFLSSYQGSGGILKSAREVKPCDKLFCRMHSVRDH